MKPHMTIDEAALLKMLWDNAGNVRDEALEVLSAAVPSQFRESFVSHMREKIDDLAAKRNSRELIVEQVLDEVRESTSDGIASRPDADVAIKVRALETALQEQTQRIENLRKAEAKIEAPESTKRLVARLGWTGAGVAASLVGFLIITITILKQSTEAAINARLGVEVPRLAQLVEEAKVASTVAAHRSVPPGTVIAFAGSTVPDGWLLCDGRPVNRSDYPELFQVISSLYGRGSSEQQFRLPDYRGVFLRGVDGGAGIDQNLADRRPPSELSKQLGYLGSFQGFATARPSRPFKTDVAGRHSHGGGSLVMSDGQWTASGMDNHGPDETNLRKRLPIEPSGEHSHTITEGGDQETRPVNVTVNYIIKAK
jgi:hypothetical protein